MAKKNVVDFRQAEKNARKRDFEVEKEKFKQEHNGMGKDKVQKALEVISKATRKDVVFYTKKSPQNKIKFAQTLQENLHYLYKHKYLTGKEKKFLMDIMPYIAFSSNCIVFDIKVKNPIPANITEIAKLIGSARQNTNTVINSLKKKGVIAKTESGIKGNNTKTYTMFINPHIIYAGDKDNVNKTLRTMFFKAMKMPILKDLPNRLF